MKRKKELHREKGRTGGAGKYAGSVFYALAAGTVLLCAMKENPAQAGEAQEQQTEAVQEQEMQETDTVREETEAAVSAVQKPVMTLEEYPRIDGSLACVPLCEKLAVELTGCSQAQAEETMADFTNTNPCYLKLAQGERDLILAYEPAQSTREALEEYEELNLQPVGRDALVFIVNADNPVDSLTQEQVRDIYAGKITNWSEVGGEDMEIRAFQRPETSGSQTLMRKLLMGDTEMEEAEIEIRPGMEDIIQAIKEYDNSANALGFSVYYYASEMYEQPDLKFLAIDGVMPSNETIRSEEYPLVNEFYCGTNSQSSQAALLIQQWLISPEGQQFVEACGYVPVN